MAVKGKGCFMRRSLVAVKRAAACPFPGAASSPSDAEAGVEFFGEPAVVAHGLDGAGMGAVVRGRSAAMLAASGQIEKVT